MVDITVEDWCASFSTCFNSWKLKIRCLLHFHTRLLFKPLRQQAFTFEIGTSLSATRIQVNYCPYRGHPYRFIVNIIHCDSAGTYNGSGSYLIFGYDFLIKNSCCSVFLGVVGPSLKPSNFWANDYQHSVSKRRATMLDPFLQLFRHCWGHSRALRMFTKSYGLYSFHNALQVPILFGVVASVS